MRILRWLLRTERRSVDFHDFMESSSKYLTKLFPLSAGRPRSFTVNPPIRPLILQSIRIPTHSITLTQVSILQSDAHYPLKQLLSPRIRATHGFPFEAGHF